MEFKDTKYVEVELTADEKTKLNDAKVVLYKLLDYAKENNKTIIDYADYDGGSSMEVQKLKGIIYDLENIYNIEGIE